MRYQPMVTKTIFLIVFFISIGVYAYDSNSVSVVTAQGEAKTSYTLTVSMEGDGMSAGYVRSDDVVGQTNAVPPKNIFGIECGGGKNACSRVYTSAKNVVLTAESSQSNVMLSGWGGACSGTQKTCTVSMNAAKNVTATFSTVIGIGGYEAFQEAQRQSQSAAGYPPHLSSFMSKQNAKEEAIRTNIEKTRTESAKILESCRADVAQYRSSPQPPSAKITECENKMSTLHALYKSTHASLGEFTEEWQKVEDRIQKGTEDKWLPGTVERGRDGVKQVAQKTAEYRATHFPHVCDYLTSSAATPPQGFGSPFEVAGDNSQLIKMRCDALRMGAVAEIGDGKTTTAVYEKAYAYKDGKWDPLYLVSENQKSGQWFIGKAMTILPFRGATSTSDVIAVYTCSQEGGTWKCGCRDRACAQSNWQIQATRKQ